MKGLILAFLLMCIYGIISKEYSPLVKIKQGVLRGFERKTWGEKLFWAFQGIPYAEPPVGENRFQPPIPAKPWEGVLDATRGKIQCPQKDVLFKLTPDVYGEEDCLFLNVYTPQIANKELAPVLVYIHGGGFVGGSYDPDAHGPEILLDKNVVMVTMNYRLGALGFLSLEDELLPGNNALKDQSLALQWVHENIKSFGGNPDKVAIYGNSAGAACVYYHILSPLSKGLFHAAMSSSGISTGVWALSEKGEAKRSAERLASFLNCPTSSNRDILNCLQKISAHDIVKASAEFAVSGYDPIIIHKPVIESNLPGAFITEHPFEIVRSGKFSHVPYVNGITANDGSIRSAPIYKNYTLIERLNAEFDIISPLVMHCENHLSRIQISKAVKRYYFQNRAVDNTTRSELTDAATDILFHYPQRITSLLHAKYSQKPVYFYLFGYRGTFSFSTLYGEPDHDFGVAHCDDIIYVLSNSILSNYKRTESDLKMYQLMSTLWYNLANTGNPTPEINQVISTKWEPVEYNKFKYYSIKGADDLQMEQRLYEDRYEFWHNLNVLYKVDHLNDEL